MVKAVVSQQYFEISRKLAGTKDTLSRVSEEGKQRERILQEENQFLRAQLMLRDEKESNTATVPPLLPEMTASWTRQAVKDSSQFPTGADVSTKPVPRTFTPRAKETVRTPKLASHSVTPKAASNSERGTIVSCVLEHCDSKRTVPRSKSVRPYSHSRTTRQECTVDRADANKRVEQRTIQRVQRGLKKSRPQTLSSPNRTNEKQQRVTFLSTIVLLLGNMFEELHLHKRRERAYSSDMSEAGLENTAQTLNKIMLLFESVLPKFSNFSALFGELSAEAAQVMVKMLEQYKSNGTEVESLTLNGLNLEL